MESPQCPPNVGGHHPGLRTKDKDGLYDGQIESSRRPGIHSLPPHYPW